ncbi:MAG TPA: glutamate--tRNA ligase [Clostridiales bacterium]|nr:glutamate--tRNA ligase [Clostridiales bacterium]
MDLTHAQRLSDLLFPGLTSIPETYESLYPPRNLEKGAAVTRFAPSPTGFVHIGGVFAALVSERLGKQTNGVFYLRIEDTDRKREIPGGVKQIIRNLREFGICFNEGPLEEGEQESGAYGPYRQSHRVRIYHCFARELVRMGLAYPCFCTEEELGRMRNRQEAEKADPGYYGSWALHRDMDFQEVARLLAEGRPYALRFRSPGSPGRRLVLQDLIKGSIELPENVHDIPLLKSDGIPTYHFAHVVDDHLMRTTHVIRGDEWLSSAPVHLQLFEALGWTPPLYAHISPVMKEEGSSRRKLSKRKDPEAAVSYYHEKGYPPESVREYLLNLINSSYEDWRRANPDKSSSGFTVELERMSVSGALFDLVKLNDVSRNTIGAMTADAVYEQVLTWAEAYALEFAALLKKDPAYAVGIFSIERGGPKPRKDIAMWSEVPEYVRYFYDEIHQEPGPDLLEGLNVAEEDRKKILAAYPVRYDPEDSQEVWFEKIRILSEEFGYTRDMKAYRKNPDAFKGHVGDVSTLIRIAVTGRRMTPDLWRILHLLGPARLQQRVFRFLGRLPE